MLHNTVRGNNDKGFALIVVLGLLATLFIMALSLGAAVRSDLAQTRRFQDETAAEFLAKGAIEWARHYLNDVENRNGMWQAPWQTQPASFRQHRLGAGTFDLIYVDTTRTRRYGIQDEEARVNINTAPVALLAALPGLTTTMAEAIATQRQQAPFSVPEALLTRGLIPPSAFYGTAEHEGLNAYLTVWGSGMININTAPAVVLMALPGLSAELAETIVRYRQGDDQQPGTADDRHFRTPADLLALPALDRETLAPFAAFLTTVPTTFRVIALGRIESGQGAASLHQRLAIIDRTSGRLRYWQRLQ